MNIRICKNVLHRLQVHDQDDSSTFHKRKVSEQSKIVNGQLQTIHRCRQKYQQSKKGIDNGGGGFLVATPFFTYVNQSNQEESFLIQRRISFAVRPATLDSLS